MLLLTYIKLSAILRILRKTKSRQPIHIQISISVSNKRSLHAHATLFSLRSRFNHFNLYRLSLKATSAAFTSINQIQFGDYFNWPVNRYAKCLLINYSQSKQSLISRRALRFIAVPVKSHAVDEDGNGNGNENASCGFCGILSGFQTGTRKVVTPFPEALN